MKTPSVTPDFTRLHAWEDAWTASQKPDYAQNLRIFEAMYQWARKLGKMKDEDALDGVENTIRLVGLLNRVRNSP